VNNVYVKTIRLKTYGPNALFDISGEIAKAVEESGIRKGVVVVFSHGSTGSLVRLKDGFEEKFRKALWDLIPIDGWEHPGNAYAHLRSTLTSTKIVIPVVDGKPVIGESRVYFVENQCYVARDRRITLAVHGEK